MAAPFLASITVLSGGGGAQPKSTGTTLLAMIIPLGGGHVDAGLPEVPVDPGWGNIGGGAHPGNKPPGSFDPARPDHELPGTPVPPTMWPPAGSVPPLPPDLESQVIIAVHRPGVVEWSVRAIPVPQPK